MSRLFILILIIAAFAGDGYAQDDIQIGTNLKNLRQTQGAYYDYSDPQGINIKVQLWGFIKHPGYYIVPARTNLMELLSLAGGPTDDAHLEDLRIFKTDSEGNQSLTKYDYNDLWWNEDLKNFIDAPRLSAGDVIIIPGSPRFYFKDYLQVGLSIFSALISLTILVLNISK